MLNKIDLAAGAAGASGRTTRGSCASSRSRPRRAPGSTRFRRRAVRALPAGRARRAARGRARRLPGLPAQARPAAAVPHLPHRPRLPRRRHAAPDEELEQALSEAGAQARRRGRGRGRGARVPVTRDPRRHLRPAAQRPRRARAGARWSSCRSTDCSCSSSPTRAIARRSRDGRDAPPARAGSRSTASPTRSRSTTHAFTVDAVRDGRFGDADLHRRRRRGRRTSRPGRSPTRCSRWCGSPSARAPATRRPISQRYGDRVARVRARPRRRSRPSEVRERVARGEPVDGLVPSAVAAAIARDRPLPRLH